jgi:hypothetical protein
VTDQPWLQPDDELLLDGVDYRVRSVLVVRADRTTFQHLTAAPQLGGERRILVQLEHDLLEATGLDPELLAGERVTVDGREFALRWDSDVRIERREVGAPPQFGRGRCAWYAAEDDAVAVLIVERYDRAAFIAEPLAPSRVDLLFTVGLRDARG